MRFQSIPFQRSHSRLPRSGVRIRVRQWNDRFTVRQVVPGVWAWLRHPSGAATTEYALLLALVIIILIGTLTALGDALREKLQMIIEKIRASG